MDAPPGGGDPGAGKEPRLFPELRNPELAPGTAAVGLARPGAAGDSLAPRPGVFGTGWLLTEPQEEVAAPRASPRFQAVIPVLAQRCWRSRRGWWGVLGGAGQGRWVPPGALCAPRCPLGCHNSSRGCKIWIVLVPLPSSQSPWDSSEWPQKLFPFRRPAGEVGTPKPLESWA